MNDERRRTDIERHGLVRDRARQLCLNWRVAQLKYELGIPGAEADRDGTERVRPSYSRFSDIAFQPDCEASLAPDRAGIKTSVWARPPTTRGLPDTLFFACATTPPSVSYVRGKAL